MHTQRHLHKSTAYHEAGHAVVGRVLTLASGGVTIKPNYDDGTWGVSHTANPYACHYQWEKRGKARDLDAAFRARIMTYMAGAETEAIYCSAKRPPATTMIICRSR